MSAAATIGWRWVVLASATLGACGGTSAVFDPDDAADAGDVGDAGDARNAAKNDAGASARDAAPPPKDAAGSFACGSTACAANQYCVHPCCGGPRPVCEPMPSSGVCPPGTHDEACFPSPGSSGFGCMPDPCTPPAPFCVDSTNDPRASGCSVSSSSPSSSRSMSCVCS